LLGARVVVEFHEVLDTGEARLPLIRGYVRIFAPLLLRLACGAVVHSDHDRAAVRQRYPSRCPILVVPHGPYDQYSVVSPRAAPADSTCNILFFGVVRPFKGLEDLVGAFDSIPEHEIGRYRLTIVGESWEGWDLPAEMIRQSPYRDRITFVNRYVRDDEVGRFFSEADVVALPYHRSSASGPLQIAMSCGLPVVVTSVGGLPEAVAEYAGAILVPPRDPVALGKALAIAAGMKGRRFTDPHSWSSVVDRYDHLFDRVSTRRRPAPGLVG
jgi:glycosyltransferase involved in cell wall biosynthesis